VLANVPHFNGTAIEVEIFHKDLLVNTVSYHSVEVIFIRVILDFKEGIYRQY